MFLTYFSCFLLEFDDPNFILSDFKNLLCDTDKPDLLWSYDNYYINFLYNGFFSFLTVIFSI